MPNCQTQRVRSGKASEEANNGVLHGFQTRIEMVGADFLFECPPDLLDRIGLMDTVSGQIADEKAFVVCQPTKPHFTLMDTGVVQKQQDWPTGIEGVQFMQTTKELDTALSGRQPVVPIACEHVENPKTGCF